MSEAVVSIELPRPTAERETFVSLMRQVLALGVPVLVEQTLHMGVGLNDTWLADHLPTHAADAGAAVGTIAYFLWFVGLVVGSIGAGSTAIISRARGARHRSMANRVCGQSVSAALLAGAIVGVGLYVFAAPLIAASELQGDAAPLALGYLRMLSLSLPFTMTMFIAGACLRGVGDTVTPAVVMILVDLVNMTCSFALTRGWWGLPVMGFNGIALGTIIAYVFGGVALWCVLLSGRGGARLYWHRLRPDLHTIRRLTRIGIPAAVCDLLEWFANLAVIGVINHMDPSNASAAAHMTTIRLEAISYMSGIAFGTAGATMVGISLGMADPHRATRCAYAAYAVGGGLMTICGILFITIGRFPAHWLAPPQENIVDMTTRCLFITGFIQSGFAANLIFGGALRGAGDTFMVMLLDLLSVISLRFTGVIYVGLVLKKGLPAIWCVLAAELFIRGCIIYGRFLQGGWKRVRV